MARILHSHGRMGMTDMTVSNPLPEDIQSLLGWVACITGANSQDAYVSILRDAGFTRFLIEDKRDLLLKMVNDVRHKLLGVELAIGLGKLELPVGIDLTKGKNLVQRSVELIESSVIGYTLIKAESK